MIDPRRIAAAAVMAIASAASAQPDVALCNLHSTVNWGPLDGVHAYSIGPTPVNAGTENVDLIVDTPEHTVIGSNMYRIMDGRIEQIGMSWLLHGFCALQQASPCVAGCEPQGGCPSFIAPGCQYPNSASRAGAQTLLGPRWQVDAHTGAFAYPFDQIGVTGDVTYKRLQVASTDLEPGLNPDALYVLEGVVVAPDDAAAGNQDNNASYRLVAVTPATLSIAFLEGHDTQFQRAAIHAWRAHGLGAGVPDPDVQVTDVRVPDEGLFILAARATDLGDGTWHYEYALENLNSHRSGASFEVPLPAGVTVTNAGFHDVDYHSGDGEGGGVNFDGTDWTISVGPDAITWSTQTFDEDPNANALRWGTLYNFRFDADAPPADATVTLGLYRPGAPDSVDAVTVGPGGPPACAWDLDGDGIVGIGDLLALLSAWDDPYTIADLLELLSVWGPCP